MTEAEQKLITIILAEKHDLADLQLARNAVLLERIPSDTEKVFKELVRRERALFAEWEEKLPIEIPREIVSKWRKEVREESAQG